MDGEAGRRVGADHWTLSRSQQDSWEAGFRQRLLWEAEVSQKGMSFGARRSRDQVPPLPQRAWVTGADPFALGVRPAILTQG